MKSQTVAIFPGTFDPPHLGHVDVLNQASKTFDEVIWAILNNPDKKPLFSLKARLAMMQEIAKELPNIHVVSFEGLLVDAAKKAGATHIVRSLRMEMDFAYEFPMTCVNRKLDPNLITIYLPAYQEHFHISSSMVRQLIKFGRDIADYVPAAVLK